MTKPYTLSTLIDDLQAIYAEHGDIDIVDGSVHERPVFAHHVTVRTADDWENTTKDDDGEIPGVGHVVSIGRRF